MRWLVLILLLLSPDTSQANAVCVDVSDVSLDPDAPAALVQAYEKVSVGLERFPSLLNALEAQSPTICLSGKMDNAHGYYDIEENRIYLNEELSPEMQVGVLLHEIRHLEQSAFGICPSDALAMEEYARATFALEADASAVSFLIAWDMKENGDGGPWAALSAWPSQSDIASAFAGEMIASGDVSSAVSAAFDQWYASDTRREKYYLAACSDFLDRQDSSHALPRYQLVPPEFLDDLCRLPNGSTYECALKEVERR